MLRLPVESSDIVAVGYDPKTRILEIEFRGGRLYQYREVEPDVHARFMKSDSLGQFFSTAISGRYRYDRIDEPGEPTGKLAFVTGNQQKFQQLQAACVALGIEIEQLDMPVDEIQSHDAEEIATKKAKTAFKLASRPVVVSDWFWNILALRGFPGAYAHHIDQWLSAEDMLRLLEGKRDRTLLLTDTLAYHDGKRTKLFSRDYSGVITDSPRGNGRPLQQITQLAGQTLTNAELLEQGKDALHAESGVWQDFAKWYKLQQRLGKVA
ncbi:MAG TPA: non-canonical purine NTP pyrophosphatase [Candidatus Saccharimonadales bacterium]|nr:non-canonical purine NTP pyrophosphatase [Candidatus Saccharimonadales bacterium]